MGTSRITDDDAGQRPRIWRKRQARALAAYVAECQVELALCHWNITVMAIASPAGVGDHNAACFISDEANVADLYFDRRFGELSRRAQRHVVCHELVHLLYEPVDRALQEVTKARGKRSVARGVYRRAMETTVDDLAWRIEGRLSLPPRRWLD